MQPKIDPEFKALLAPLTKEEYAGLEESILERGCLDTIKTWDDYIIDGHNRFSICMRHGLLFDTEPLDFDTREDVIEWMIRNQLARRNQTPEQISYFRGKLYEQMKKAEGGRSDRAFGVEKITTPKTAQKIADDYGVTEKTIRNDADYAKAIDTIAEHVGDDVKQQILSGEINLPKSDIVEIAQMTADDQMAVLGAEKPKDAIKHVRGTLGTGENEWYTPSEYLDMARAVMGNIDTDPASSDLANETVQAAEYFTVEDDGLTKEWHGNVWLNPPYAQPAIAQFAAKAIEEWQAKRIASLIVLTHNYSDTSWFHQLANHATAICFTRGRIRFIAPDGTLASPTQGQAIFYFGKDRERFFDTFRAIGFVVVVAAESKGGR